MEAQVGIDNDGLRFIAMALAIGLGAIGPGAGIGVVFSGALQAMGRNPEAEGMLRTYMFLGFALAEVPFILSMVFGLLIGFKII